MFSTLYRDLSLIPIKISSVADVRFGSKQTLKRLHPMSALLLKADIVQHGGNVRFVPEAEQRKRTIRQAPRTDERLGRLRERAAAS
jgi:hypothetical protein